MAKVEKTHITDPEQIEKILEARGYQSIFTWTDPAGTFYNWHTHPYEEVRWIVEGEITIGTEEGEIYLRPGDLLRIPSGTKHWARTEKGATYICASKHPQQKKTSQEEKLR